MSEDRTPPDRPPSPLDLAELGQILGLHRTTLARRHKNGRIHFDDGSYIATRLIGRRIVVPVAKLRRFLGEEA